MAPGYTKEPNNGTYGIVNSTGLEQNMDILATYSNDWKDFTFSISGGGNTFIRKVQR